MELNFYWILKELGLDLNPIWIGPGLDMDRILVGFGLNMDRICNPFWTYIWIRIGVNRILIGFPLDLNWILIEIGIGSGLNLDGLYWIRMRFSN